MIQVPCWAEFVDIPKTHWAEASVKKVTQDYQIMNGYPGNKFAGTADLSRSEAASIIDKLFINFVGLLPLTAKVHFDMRLEKG